MGGIEWGPVAAWAGAIATVLVVITTSLVALGYFDRFRAPRLQVTFSSTEPWVRRGPLHDGTEAQWLRLGVENIGKTAAVGCVGRLSSVRTDGTPRPDIDPVQLRWAGVPRSRGFAPLDLRPGQREYLNVAMRPDDGAWHLATFEDPDFDRAFTTDLSSDARHELHVSVFAGNARAAAVLVIDGTGDALRAALS